MAAPSTRSEVIKATWFAGKVETFEVVRFVRLIKFVHRLDAQDAERLKGWLESSALIKIIGTLTSIQSRRMFHQRRVRRLRMPLRANGRFRRVGRVLMVVLAVAMSLARH